MHNSGLAFNMILQKIRYTPEFLIELKSPSKFLSLPKYIQLIIGRFLKKNSTKDSPFSVKKKVSIGIISSRHSEHCITALPAC